MALRQYLGYCDSARCSTSRSRGTRMVTDGTPEGITRRRLLGYAAATPTLAVTVHLADAVVRPGGSAPALHNTGRRMRRPQRHHHRRACRRRRPAPGAAGVDRRRRGSVWVLPAGPDHGCGRVAGREPQPDRRRHRHPGERLPLRHLRPHPTCDPPCRGFVRVRGRAVRLRVGGVSLLRDGVASGEPITDKCCRLHP